MSYQFRKIAAVPISAALVRGVHARGVRLAKAPGFTGAELEAGAVRQGASTHNGTPILPQTDVQQQMDDFARAAAQRVYTQHCGAQPAIASEAAKQK